jgi:hypothetical protein
VAGGLAGGLMGAATGDPSALVVIGGGLLLGAGSGAVGGLVSSVLAQGIDRGQIDWVQVGVETGIGAVLGLGLGGVGSGIRVWLRPGGAPTRTPATAPSTPTTPAAVSTETAAARPPTTAPNTPTTRAAAAETETAARPPTAAPTTPTTRAAAADEAATAVAPVRTQPLLGGSAQRQAYLDALRAEGPQNYQFIRAAGQQYSERSCVPGVLQQRLGSSPDMARMVELADRQGGYTLQQAQNYLRNNGLVPAANMRHVETISIQDLAARAAQANGRTTTVLNVRGTSGPHAVGVQGYVPIEGVPGGGAFRIHDPLTGTEYWLSARSLQQRMTGQNLGSALLID